MRTVNHVAIMLVLSMVTLFGANSQQSYQPKNGFVPDERTAIRVAEAILSAIYGDKQIKSEEPFSAKLRDGIWTVSGTIAEGVEGGVAEIKISKKDATVIYVNHGM